MHLEKMEKLCKLNALAKSKHFYFREKYTFIIVRVIVEEISKFSNTTEIEWTLS